MQEMNKRDEADVNSVEDIKRSWPNIEVIKDLRRRNYVADGSPLWWSTDYARDPRENIPFEEFQSRLVHLGKREIIRSFLSDKWTEERDIYLYPEEKVPMTTLNLNVNGLILPFLVTARPYHPKELEYPGSFFLYDHPLETLPAMCNMGEKIDLNDHFYPHVRGIYGGQRGNHFFWYIIHPGYFPENFDHDIQKALNMKGLSYIHIYHPCLSSRRRYCDTFDELKERRDLISYPDLVWPDFGYEEVNAEEFISDWENTDNNLLVQYPLRLEGIESTLPLVIANKTNEGNRIRKPAVLGIFASNHLDGRSHRGGIFRIKNLQMAQKISSSISQDFQIPVDCVLFTPQPGCPKYERISA